jgi:general secretion pathway protein J
MNRRRSGRRRMSVAGFTLVEALAAVLLMGMILAALVVVTGQWLPGWNHGVARLQRAELVALSLERLAGDLSAAEFIAPNRKTPHPLFEGGELFVTFVRSAIGPNTRGGLEVVRIAETADQRGPLVVRTRAPFAPTENPIDQFDFADPVMLLHTPYRLSFAYAGRDKVWKAFWHDEELLPQAVRMTVRDAATDRALAISTAVVVHAELPAECTGQKNSQLCQKELPAGAQNDSPSAESPARSAR